MLRCVWLFGTPWAVAHQALPSMEFSRKEYWSALPFPAPGDLPDPSIKPVFPAFAGDFFTIELPGEPPAPCKSDNYTQLLIQINF